MTIVVVAKMEYYTFEKYNDTVKKDIPKNRKSKKEKKDENGVCPCTHRSSLQTSPTFLLSRNATRVSHAIDL